MDLSGIIANINKIDNKEDLAAYKETVLPLLESQAEGFAAQAAQLAGLTNPATFIASFISMLVPLTKTVTSQVTYLNDSILKLTKAFSDKESNLS